VPIWVIVGIILILVFMNKANPSGSSATAGTIANEFGDKVVSEANSYGLPPRRILGMIYQESTGNPGARGKAGEVGLMQLLQAALTDVNAAFGTNYTLASVQNASENIEAGTAYLYLQFRQFSGDIDKATQAYNAGAGAVRNNPEAGMDYLNRVKAKEALFSI
jgi:soluble lytic murein transglycosylase-like protein